MYQLKNVQHDFEVAVGDIGTTVRLGDKWLERFNENMGSLDVSLWECAFPHEGDCPLQDNAPQYGRAMFCKYRGKAQIIGAWFGELGNIPPKLLQLEHEESSRTLSGLKKSLERGYTKRFSGKEKVSVLIYYRISDG